jgi:hypothetical protein
MKTLRSKLLGLVALLGLGVLGGCYAGPYHSGYYRSGYGYYSPGYNYYSPGYRHHGRGYRPYGRGFRPYGRGYNYYGRGFHHYGRYAVPPPAPVCRRIWVPPGADFWGRWQPGHWRCA